MNTVPPGEPPARVKPAVQVLQILERVARSSTGLSFTDLLTELGLPKGSLHNGLQVLLGAGYVRQDERTRAFWPAPRLLELGAGYLSSTEFPQTAVPVVREAAEFCPETISLGMLEDGSVLIVHTSESRQTVRVSVPVGSRWPLHCSAQGLAMLARVPELELPRLLPSDLPAYTSKTPRTLAELAERLVDVRRDGVALVRGEVVEEHCSVGSAVLGPGGQVLGAVSIAAPISRADDAAMARMARMVAAVAAHASGRLGHLESLRNAPPLAEAWADDGGSPRDPQA